MEKILNFINGQFADPLSGNWLENVSPANGRITGAVVSSGSADVQAAVESANQALPEWSTSSLEFRSNVLMRIAALIEKNLDELAVAESQDSGKPITNARTIDIPRSAANFRFFANAITQFASESHETASQNQTQSQPLQA